MNPTQKTIQITDVETALRFFETNKNIGTYEGLEKEKWYELLHIYISHSPTFESYSLEDIEKLQPAEALEIWRKVFEENLAASTPYTLEDFQNDIDQREKSKQIRYKVETEIKKEISEKQDIYQRQSSDSTKKQNTRQTEIKIENEFQKVQSPIVVPPPETKSVEQGKDSQELDSNYTSLLTYPRRISSEGLEKIRNIQVQTEKGKETFVKQYSQEYVRLSQATNQTQLPSIIVQRSLENFFDQLQKSPRYLGGQITGIPSLGEKIVLTTIVGDEIANVFTSSPKNAVYENPVPVSTPLASVRLALATKEIAKEDPKRAVAAHFASKGYVDPVQIETLKQNAAKLGVVIKEERLKELAEVMTKHQGEFLFIPTSKNETKITAIEFQALSNASNLELNSISTPSYQGVKGYFFRVGQQLFGKSSKEVLDYAIKKGVQKVGAKLSTAAAIQTGAAVAAGTTSTGLAATLGTAASFVATPLGGLIVFLATELGTIFITKIWPWLKERLTLLGGGLLLGGIALGISSPLGAFSFVTGLSGIFGGLVANGSAQLGTLFGSIQTGVGWVFRTSLSEIGKPILICIISIPLTVAFIMFIINSGAYVIPTDSGAINGGGGQGANGSCPIPSGVVTCGSLGSGNPHCEHGNFGYWNSNINNPANIANGSEKLCKWGLPSADGAFGVHRCSESPLQNSPCYDATSQCKNTDGTSVYGFAADIRYPNQSRCDESLTVQFPYMDGKKLTWNKILSFSNANGANGVYHATDGNNTYEMYMTHLKSVASSGESGSIVGSLSCNLSYPHVHIEMRVNGDYIRPDTLCGPNSNTPPEGDDSVSGGSCTADGPYGPGSNISNETVPVDSKYTERGSVDDVRVLNSVYSRLIEFLEFARSNGYQVVVYEGYRTYERQLAACEFCQGKLKTDPNYPCAAAAASQSQHRSGQAVDLYIGAGFSSVEGMLRDEKIKRKMEELNISHPYPADTPHFNLD